MAKKKRKKKKPPPPIEYGAETEDWNPCASEGNKINAWQVLDNEFRGC